MVAGNGRLCSPPGWLRWGFGPVEAVSRPRREKSLCLSGAPAVNSWLRLRRIAGESVAWLLIVTAFSLPMPVAAQDTSPAALYTASDFPALADGVDPGFAGEASVHVWSSSQDEWSLTPGKDSLTLNHRERAGDPVPRWQTLGKVRLEKGRPLKIVVTYESNKSDDRSQSATTPQAKAKEQRKGRSSEKKPPKPVPALVWLTSYSDTGAAPVLDLIRGRVDTIEPSPDRRRVEVRTNYQGADFQAPATAAAWRDRAEHLRDQMRVTLGLWPMFPKTPLRPRSTASSLATATRSRRWCSRPSPGSRSAATSIGRPRRRARSRASSARTATGKTAGSIPRCSSAVSDGRSWAASSSLRHGRVQRQQAVPARVPQRSPAAMGPEPPHAPDLEQHPGSGLADGAARRRRHADRLHRRVRAAAPRRSCSRPWMIGSRSRRRWSWSPTPSRAAASARTPRACGSAPTTSSSPRCAPPGR